MPESARRSTPRPWPRRVGRLVLIVLLVGVLPYLAYDHASFSPVADYPLVFVLGIWGVLLVLRGIVRARRGRGGALAFNLGFLCLALAAAEAWVGLSSGIPKHMVRTPTRAAYVEDHPDLGYVPLPDRASRFTAVSEGDEIYDVTYTIGANGLRVAPPLSTPHPEGSVLCFGCSFTFGSGLDDDQTIPWQLEQDLGGNLRVYNFGFSGYGPHQMLANIESGRVEAIVEFPPRHVLYLAIPDHARRVAGAAVHDRRGPRYVLEADGSVRREGTFHDVREKVWRKRLFQFLNHSHLGQAITRRLGRSEGSVELMAAVVAAARDATAARWPEAAFEVLLWDDHPGPSEAVERALIERGIPVTRVSALLPGFAEAPQRFRLHRVDEHPSAAAAAAIAAALSTRMTTSSTRGDEDE